MKNKTFVVVTIIYCVFLGHFLFSNFVKTSGPKYLIKSSGYQRESNLYCPPQSQIYGQCLYSCPLMTAEPTTPNIKGFPFQTNDFNGVCGSVTAYATTDFTEAIALDGLYMLIVTCVYVGFVYTLSIKKSRKSGTSIP